MSMINVSDKWKEQQKCVDYAKRSRFEGGSEDECCKDFLIPGVAGVDVKKLENRIKTWGMCFGTE